MNIYNKDFLNKILPCFKKKKFATSTMRPLHNLYAKLMYQELYELYES